MSKPEHVPTLAQVVGENLATLRRRRRLSQEQAAKILRTAGLDWKKSKVAALEVGRRETIALWELFLLSVAFGVEVASWFAGEGPVRGDFLPQAVTTRGQVRDFFGAALPGVWVADPPQGREEPTDAERRAARKLGISTRRVRVLAHMIWGQSLDEERDGHVGPDADPRKKGHISRVLVAEMRARLDQLGMPEEDEE